MPAEAAIYRALEPLQGEAAKTQRFQVRFQFTISLPSQGRVAFLPFCNVRLTALKSTPYPREPRTIGDHLKKRRCELGLRQIDAGKQIGVTADTILNWETNACPPSIQ